MECNESFSDFQENIVTKKVNTRHRLTKTKKPLSNAGGNKKTERDRSHFPNVNAVVTQSEVDVPVADDLITNTIVTPVSTRSTSPAERLESTKGNLTLNDTILLSNSVWACVLCGESVQQQNRDSHFSQCIKTYDHKKKKIQKGGNLCNVVPTPYFCDVCKLNITCLSVHQRAEHVNKCLDADVTNHENNSSSSQHTITITECPLCLKNCASVEARITHIKKCSISKGLDVASVLAAIELQRKHALERWSLGLPALQTKPTAIRAEHLPKKAAKEPTSQADADLQLAKALSLSVQEEEKQKEITFLEATDLSEFCLSKPESASSVPLKPPRNNDRPGRRKKNVAKPVPILILRTGEERQKLLEEKVSALVAVQSAGECDVNNLNFSYENCHLWNLCGMAGEKMQYYVQDMAEFLTPSATEAGSKLRSLSQVPGHQVYTQKPCDFTFSCTPDVKENNSMVCLKNSSNVPSTQEMLDIIVSTDGEGGHVKASPLQCVSSNENKDLYSLQERIDGFFPDPNDETPYNVVVDALVTLVGNTWMSDADVLCSDGRTIPVHSLLLRLRCPALRKVLDVSLGKGRPVLDWSVVSSDSAWHFLQFVYTAVAKWPPSLNAEISYLAEQCEIKTFGSKRFDSDKPFVPAPPEFAGRRSKGLSSENNVSVLKELELDSSGISENVNEREDSAGEGEKLSGNEKEISQCSLIPKTSVSPSSSPVKSPSTEEVKNITFLQGSDSSMLKNAVVDTPDHLEYTEQRDVQFSPDLFPCEDDSCSVYSVSSSVVKEPLAESVRTNSCLDFTNLGIAVPELPPILSPATKAALFTQKINISGTAMTNSLDHKLTECDILSEKFVSSSFGCKSNEAPPVHQGESGNFHKDNNCKLLQSVYNIETMDEDEIIVITPPENKSPYPNGKVSSNECLQVVTLNSAYHFETPTTSKKTLRKMNSDSLIGIRTPLSEKFRHHSFSEVTTHSEQLTKMSFSVMKQLKTDLCSMSANSLMDQNEEHCSPTSAECYRGNFPRLSPIILSSDEEIVDSTELKVRSEFSAENCNEIASQVQESNNQEELELLPLSMRIASAKSLVVQHAEPQIITSLRESSDASDDEFPCQSQRLTSSTATSLMPSAAKVLPNSSPLLDLKHSADANKTPDVPKRAKTKHSNKVQLTDSPITPLPDYTTMVTPEIKMALKKYGVRALPKKKAVALLMHIYDETHPWVEVESGNCVAIESGTNDSDSVTRTASKKRKMVEGKTAENPKQCGKRSKLKTTQPNGIVLSQETESNSISSSLEISSSQTSSKSDADPEDMPEESHFSSEPEDCSADSTSVSKDAIRDMIYSNKSLYSKVLMYEPLQLGDFHQELKEKNIKISVSQLMDLLDEECITFTVPRNEKYKKKQQVRSQKFRKRVIATLSQPTAP